MVFEGVESAGLAIITGTTFRDNIGEANIDAHGICDAHENADPPNSFDLTACV